MKNIVLDLMMGLLCIVLAITIIGTIIVPEVLEQWADMRSKQKKCFILEGEIKIREYIQYYKDGRPSFKGFTVSGCGTSTFYREITKEEYDRLSTMTYGEVDDEIEKNYLMLLNMVMGIMDISY